MTKPNLTENLYRQMKDSLEPGARTMNTAELDFLARVLKKARPLERDRLLPVFNECARRIAWGCLPQAPSIDDVFAEYRDIITWTKTPLSVS